MKPLLILLFAVCVACFYSCSPGHDVTPQNLIVAKWNLQQQHAVLYEDNIKITDTVFNASAITFGVAQFNNNGSFTSSSVYRQGGNSLLAAASNESTMGTYTYSANAFTITPGLAGWFSYVTGSSTSPTGNSTSAQVTTLTSSNLDIHATSTFGTTNITGPHTFNLEFDYYYTR
jgi:hypothetical protein